MFCPEARTPSHFTCFILYLRCSPKVLWGLNHVLVWKPDDLHFLELISFNYCWALYNSVCPLKLNIVLRKLLPAQQGLQLVCEKEEDERQRSAVDKAECMLLLSRPVACGTRVGGGAGLLESSTGFCWGLLVCAPHDARAVMLSCLGQEGGLAPWVAFVFLR